VWTAGAASTSSSQSLSCSAMNGLHVGDDFGPCYPRPADAPGKG
jgi:hypothetical protein